MVKVELGKKIEREKLTCLLPGAWLNDEVKLKPVSCVFIPTYLSIQKAELFQRKFLAIHCVKTSFNDLLGGIVFFIQKALQFDFFH